MAFIKVWPISPSAFVSLWDDSDNPQGSKETHFSNETTGKPHPCCCLSGNHSFSVTNQLRYFSLWYPETSVVELLFLMSHSPPLKIMIIIIPAYRVPALEFHSNFLLSFWDCLPMILAQGPYSKNITQESQKLSLSLTLIRSLSQKGFAFLPPFRVLKHFSGLSRYLPISSH